jgi:hypothetical protein
MTGMYCGILTASCFSAFTSLMYCCFFGGWMGMFYCHCFLLIENYFNSLLYEISNYYVEKVKDVFFVISIVLENRLLSQRRAI